MEHEIPNQLQEKLQESKSEEKADAILELVRKEEAINSTKERQTMQFKIIYRDGHVEERYNESSLYDLDWSEIMIVINESAIYVDDD